MKKTVMNDVTQQDRFLLWSLGGAKTSFFQELSFYLFLSHTLSFDFLCLAVSLSFSHSFFLTFCVSLFLTTLSPSVFLCLSLSHALYFWLSVSVSFSHSLSCWLSVPLSLSLCVSLTLSCLCLSLYVSLTLSVSLPVSLSLSLCRMNGKVWKDGTATIGGSCFGNFGN